MMTAGEYADQELKYIKEAYPNLEQQMLSLIRQSLVDAYNEGFFACTSWKRVVV